MKVPFINEVADLCEALDANVEDVARGIGLDDRIGPRFLQAGPGYGGSCFPKDILALVTAGREHGSPTRLVETTLSVNEDRKRKMVRKVVAATGGSVHGKSVAVLGLTFKANTDDVRYSPAIAITQALQELGAVIRAYDPQGMEAAAGVLSNVSFCSDAYDAATGAHAIVLATGWNEFRSLDFDRLAAVMANRVVVDLRNLYAPDKIGAHGFSYTSVGRPGVIVANKLALAAE
jgi:UDPglucose 6-dehydrogenase